MSEVSICNRALALLGSQPITSLTEDTEAARRLNIFYDDTRKELLRIHPWNFAINRDTLAQLATAPEYEYTYYYALPSDYLRMLTVSDGTNQLTDWKIENNKLAIDSTTVVIRYVKDETDTSKFDEGFKAALSYRLAADACFALTGKADLAQELFGLAEEKLRVARSLDAQDSGAVEEVDKDVWTQEMRY